MNNPLFLFVGKSASGKTTIANILEQEYGYKQVSSYTTRPPRYDGEIGHIFVNDIEFNNLGEMVAYTEYNGYKYGTTAEQLDQCSIYVVDVPGVETLLERYETNRQIVIIYFHATVYTRINRMLNRHDSDMSIISRLLQDEKDDWSFQLDSLVWDRDVEYHTINADLNQAEVLEMVQYYMNYMEDEEW